MVIFVGIIIWFFALLVLFSKLRLIDKKVSKLDYVGFVSTSIIIMSMAVIMSTLSYHSLTSDVIDKVLGAIIAVLLILDVVLIIKMFVIWLRTTRMS